MESGNPPTKDELESIRLRLVVQIEEAQQLFSTEGNGHELLTSKAALKSIEQLIRRMRKQRPKDEVA